MFFFFLMESITLGTSYHTCAFCKRLTLPQFLSCGREVVREVSIILRSIWRICLRTKSGRLCLSLWISHRKNKALQGVFLVTLSLIKWIIWIQCSENELFVTDFICDIYRNWLLKHFFLTAYSTAFTAL